MNDFFKRIVDLLPGGGEKAKAPSGPSVTPARRGDSRVFRQSARTFVDDELLAPMNRGRTKPDKPAWIEPATEWADKTAEPVKAVRAGVDENGDHRIRMGLSHPGDYEDQQRNGMVVDEPETPSFADRFMKTDGDLLGIVGDVVSGQKTLGEAIVGSRAANAETINDINLRLGNLRKWGADDPFEDGDEDQVRITLKNGASWRAPVSQDEQGDVLTYRELGDGTIISDDDLVNNVIPLSGGVNYMLPGGRVVSREVIDARRFHHSAFPDGTVYMNADGSLSPEVMEAQTKQIDTGFLGTGIADPRAPWENEAGDFFLESDYWDRDGDGKMDALGDIAKRSAIDEAIPWLIDMNLNSLPYYIPGYNVVSAGSAATPYVVGFDGDTYMPEGSGFNNLGSLGQGTYKDERLTHAQQAGGILSPLVEATVERVGGKAIGGVENRLPKGIADSAFGRFLAEHPIGKIISAAIEEGGEEMITAPLDRLETDGWENYAKNSEIDNATGRLVYEDTSVKDRLMNLGKDELTAALAGATLGAGTSMALSGPSTLRYFRDRRDIVPEAPELERIRRNQEMLERIDESGENR